MTIRQLYSIAPPLMERPVYIDGREPIISLTPTAHLAGIVPTVRGYLAYVPPAQRATVLRQLADRAYATFTV